jgi:NTE family protein
MGAEKQIGLALGAGGASGLAHILMLEAFDELGLRPVQIAGSSIGAIIGSLYASGKSAQEIKAIVRELVGSKKSSWKDFLLNKEIFQWIELIDPGLGKGGFISGDAFLTFLFERVQAATFDELEIPLAVTATDFWKGEQVVCGSGDLASAVQGSMAMPGLFSPVRRGGRLLIDGGAVNPVPYDILQDSCELTVAVDVIGQRTPKEDLSLMDAVFNTFKIMQRTIVQGKYELRPPDIAVTPKILDIRALEFYKADSIFEQALPAKEELKKKLEARLFKG